MRIIQLLNRLDSSDGGPARNAAELNAHLAEVGKSNVPLYVMKPPHAPSSTVEARTQRGTPAHPSWASGRGRLAQARFFARALGEVRRADAVILHGFYLWWIPVMAIVGRLSGTIVVVTPHGSLTPHQESIHSGRKRVWNAGPGRLTVRCTNLVMTGSVREREQLRQRLPRTRVEHGGVGCLAGIHTAPKPRISESTVRLVSLGRLVPKKRVDLAIGTVTELQATGVKCHLDIFGEGSEEKGLRELAERLGRVSDVQFHGHVDDAAEKSMALRAADILLFPSDDENFGIVALEALAVGTPVVASPHVASMDGVMSAAAMVVPQTPAEMAKAVRTIAGHYEESSRAALKEAARFAWPDVAKNWLQHVESVVAAERAS